MISEDQDRLLIRYIEGKATLSESKQIMEWLNSDNQNKLYFIALKKTYIELKLDASKNNSDTESAYQNFLERVSITEFEDSEEEEPLFILFNKKFLRYAAIFIAFLSFTIGSFLFGRMTIKTQDNSFCEISAPLGGKSSVTLPDGTKIWLNAGSKIKYDENFNVSSRDVFLEGEAYFDVSKKNRPFIVHTSDIDIRVYGTSFNVKSYPDEDRIETTLVEGLIRIERKESDETLYLSPKEKLVFHKMGKEVEINDPNIDSIKEITDNKIELETTSKIEINPIEITKNVNTEEYVSWKDGSLIFNQESLESLAKKLERKYDITFSFESEELKKYSFSGTLKDFPLEQVLRALKFTSPIDYTINEKTVVLSYNNKFNY